MRTRNLLPGAIAEQLFLVGGEDMQPFYPQAGHDPDYDKRFPVAYVVGDASIDEMSFAGKFPLPIPEIFIRRNKIAGRVRSNIKNAGQIEADRRHLANEFRKMILRHSVNLTE